VMRMPTGKSHILHRGGGGGAGAGGRSLGSPGLAAPVRWRVLCTMVGTPLAGRLSMATTHCQTRRRPHSISPGVVCLTGSSTRNSR